MKENSPICARLAEIVSAGVFGWPVSHSRSPRLHGFWLAKYGIDGAYLPLATRPENLADAIRALPKLGFRGANVTLPHKERAGLSPMTSTSISPSAMTTASIAPSTPRLSSK